MRQFVESIKRLYKCDKINKEKVIELYDNDKITEVEKNYILDAN